MAPMSKHSESWQELLSKFVESWPPTRWRDVGVVVGCSGGADSVALLRAICECRAACQGDGPRGFVAAAHFNHAIRGEESDGDERFVQQLATQLEVPFEVGRNDGSATDESKLRQDRLDFLQASAHRLGARYIVLAHSCDDNVETVLHHLMRGSGPSGLAGIRRHRSHGADLVIVRPMLSIRRQLIRDALRAVGQSWREDSSNANTDYRRNWIRHELLPKIESQYPQATEAIARAAEAQRGWWETIQRHAIAWLDQFWIGRDPVQLRHCSETDESILVAALQHLWSLQGWPRRAMARDHWLRLVTTIRQPANDRYSLPGGIDVISTSRNIEIKRSGNFDPASDDS